jgi:hypothetical protein
MTSAKKVAANRKNAKSSTGPTTELGKSRSSHNSMKHGVLADELIIDEAGRTGGPPKASQFTPRSLNVNLSRWA